MPLAAEVLMAEAWMAAAVCQLVAGRPAKTCFSPTLGWSLSVGVGLCLINESLLLSHTDYTYT